MKMPNHIVNVNSLASPMGSRTCAWIASKFFCSQVWTSFIGLGAIPSGHPS